MKKLVLLAVLLLSFSVMAVAEDVPAAEIFGGYSYFHCDTRGADVGCNLNGWNASFAFNANKYVGVVVDLGGYYGTVGEPTGVDVKAHSYMFGPKFTLRRGKVAPFAQVLFGLTHINQGVHVLAASDFSMAFGGGLDYSVSDKFAVRPVQVEYFTTRSASEFTNNFRFSAGIIFKFGKK